MSLSRITLAPLVNYHKRNKRFRKRALDFAAVIEAKVTLLAFMEAYYHWETAVYRDAQQARSERTTTDTNTPPYEDRDFWERLAHEHRELVGQFCTAEYQHHSYSLSYGTPPKLNPTTTQFIEVQYVTKNKLLLYTREWSAVESYYEYTLTHENEHWRVAKRRWWINGGWRSTYV
ncbi:MAG: RhsIA family immunity protein [Chloroflexota bacterium]|nr:RhsIA family immunity protein [Chloroflexota bacterium]